MAHTKEQYLQMVSEAYDLGAKIAEQDAARGIFRKPYIACKASGVAVLSASGSAFIRAYVDNFPQNVPVEVVQ